MNTDDWRSSWVEEKCSVALALHSEVASAGYAEAILVLCAVLSAISAEVWPGRRIDRVRFVELLVRFASNDLYAATISVPILTQSLSDSGRTGEANIIATHFLQFDPTRVLIGADVDKAELEILSACPSVASFDLRKYSYAALLYKDVRSAYAHEYGPGHRASSWPMTLSPDPKVSYVNRLTDKGPKRLIHFHIEWVTHLAKSIAANLTNTMPPLEMPTNWWLENNATPPKPSLQGA